MPGICKGNLGVARCDMPQMPGSASLLNGSSFFVTNITDRDIAVEVLSNLDVDKFTATQDQLNLDKVDRMIQTVYDGNWRGFIWNNSDSFIQVAEDGFIIDGHHRWATIYALQQNATFMAENGFNAGDHLPLSVMQYTSTLQKMYPDHPPRPVTVTNMIAIANQRPCTKKKYVLPNCIAHKCECYEESPSWYDCKRDHEKQHQK